MYISSIFVTLFNPTSGEFISRHMSPLQYTPMKKNIILRTAVQIRFLSVPSSDYTFLQWTGIFTYTITASSPHIPSVLLDVIFQYYSQVMTAIGIMF
jgi:hypothetical protein